MPVGFQNLQNLTPFNSIEKIFLLLKYSASFFDQVDSTYDRKSTQISVCGQKIKIVHDYKISDKGAFVKCFLWGVSVLRFRD